MTQEDYCSFEVAKLLKEKGFNWDYITYYVDSEPDDVKYSMLFENNTTWEERCCSAPTLQLTIKWLREVHGLSVETFSIKGTSNICPVFWKGNVVKLLTQDRVFSGELVGSYEEAVEAALKYSLENLI